MILNFKNPYIYLNLEDGSEIHVKLDSEGVVIDRYINGELGETTSKTYQEMVDGE